jgi:hypothetical protein
LTSQLSLLSATSRSYQGARDVSHCKNSTIRREAAEGVMSKRGVFPKDRGFSIGSCADGERGRDEARQTRRPSTPQNRAICREKQQLSSS